jgi:hypothetical protein
VNERHVFVRWLGAGPAVDSLHSFCSFHIKCKEHDALSRNAISFSPSNIKRSGAPPRQILRPHQAPHYLRNLVNPSLLLVALGRHGPGQFCPNRCESGSPMSRANTSGAKPAGISTIMRTGRDGCENGTKKELDLGTNSAGENPILSIRGVGP